MDAAVVVGKHLVGLVCLFAARVSFSRRFLHRAGPRGWLPRGSPTPVIARVVFYGFAWGIAQVLFGLSVERIGMALTFSIVLGSSAAIGTLLPFIRLHSELLFTAAGGFIVAGVVFVGCGMVLCALAGFRRENEARATPVPQRY